MRLGSTDEEQCCDHLMPSVIRTVFEEIGGSGWHYKIRERRRGSEGSDTLTQFHELKLKLVQRYEGQYYLFLDVPSIPERQPASPTRPLTQRDVLVEKWQKYVTQPERSK